jgi:acyl-CoA thioesterase
MELLEQLKQEMKEKNTFTNYNHIELDAVERDRVVFRMKVHPESKNPYGIIHGGALYTMADNATGVAAHTDGRHYVTQNGSLHFLRNVKEGTVYAEGRVRHRGRATCLVEVDITDDAGQMLATGEFAYFCIDSRAE